MIPARSTFYDPSRNLAWTPIQDTPGLSDDERFGSAHPGGCFIGFLDGHVEMIEYDIDPAVHCQNGHRADGGSCVDPG